MAIIKLWAGKSSFHELPSPISVQPTMEQIWSEDTGRAQSGTEKAKMIGSVIDEKMTYAIKWGVLEYGDSETLGFKDIVENMPKGFFYFHLGETAPSELPDKKFYRSEIAYDVIQVGSDVYYKDVTVSVIEQ